jgi:hypothetical protein
MSTDAVPTLTAQQIAHLVERLKHELSHPDVLDRALTGYALAEWVRALSHAGLAESDLDLPLTLTAAVTKDVKNDDGSFQQCQTHHISLFGHEVVSWDSCQSGSGTGTGHSSGGMSTTGG